MIPCQMFPFLPLSVDEQDGELTQLEAALSMRAPVRRSAALIDHEYGRDKYGAVLATSPETIVKASEALLRVGGIDPGQLRTAVLGQQLYRAPFAATIFRHDAVLDAALHRAAVSFGCDWFCELGCGFGPHVARLGPTAYGGEYTNSGVTLGRQLGVDLQKFNFLNLDDYAMIRPRSIVYTCAAVEQLPSAKCLIDGLRRQKHNINGVVHLEPTVLSQRIGRLGLLQNAYIERCDYNRDLDLLLRAAPDVELCEVQHDVIGLNPLNPASLFVWRFRT